MLRMMGLENAYGRKAMSRVASFMTLNPPIPAVSCLYCNSAKVYYFELYQKFISVVVSSSYTFYSG
jgi:hypothetical protein